MESFPFFSMKIVFRNVRGANQQAPNAQSAQANSAAMRNAARPITGQQTAANMQTRPVAPQLAAGQARTPNYKFTQSMRNPQVPQPVPIPAQPVAQQAVIVKGKRIVVVMVVLDRMGSFRMLPFAARDVFAAQLLLQKVLLFYF